MQRCSMRALALRLSCLMLIWYSWPAHSQYHTPLPAGVTSLNVKNAAFGATGNGTTDDTRAIQKAIDSSHDARRLVYLPRGTYLVSNIIAGADTAPNRDMYSRFYTIHGEGRGRTVIKLKDNCPGYGDPARPRPVVLILNKKAWEDTLTWSNDCHSVHLLHFSVDVGQGNPAAVGIDFTSHNGGGIEDVEIVAGPTSGKIGLACNRIYPGPSLINNISIRGFDYGIHCKQLHYNMVFENITLENQRRAAILNQDLSVSMRKVTSRNSVPAVYNIGREGMMLLLDCDFSGGHPDSCAIVSSDVLYLRNVTTSGYKAAVKQQGQVLSAYGSAVGEHLSEDWRVTYTQSPRRSLNLLVKESPSIPWDTAMTDWQSVRSFQNLVAGGDWAPAIQAAIDAGKPTVYFPNLPRASYTIRSTVHVRGQVRRIMGFMANINGGRVVVDNANASATILIEQLNIDSLVHQSPATLSVRRALGLYMRAGQGGAGDLFLDDATWGNMEFTGANVWVRQLNNEDRTFKVRNAGGKLWILGYKTENATTVLFNEAGAATEILGGFIYPLTDAAIGCPLYVNNSSALSFVHTYDTTWITDRRRPAYIVQETRGGHVQNVNPDFPRATRMNKLMYVTNPDSIGNSATSTLGRGPGRTARQSGRGGFRISLVDAHRGLVIVSAETGAHTVTICRADGSVLGAYFCREPYQILRLSEIEPGVYFARSQIGTAAWRRSFAVAK